MPSRPGTGGPGAAPPTTDAAARGTLAIVPGKVYVPRLRGMPRERLDLHLDDLWQHGLALVVAPAGSGKTTLLAAWAAAAAGAGVPVAWYRAESTDGDPMTLLGFLEAAVVEAVDAGLGRGWSSVEAAADGLRRWPGERLLLVIDDLHTIGGTEAEATLERFLDYAGPSLAVAAGTRTLPGFNLSRRRVSGRLLEIGGDDLRFRSWEVEALFRDYYGESLRGDELASLARRTEGWAAGLQLFHLATRGKPSSERRRFLEGLAGSSRLVREYLARNVLDELPEELRSFLIDSCVLRRLSGPLCDRFMGRSGSATLLAELERRQVFTVALDDEGTYRYHEVLRGHLEGVLVEERGAAAARASSARAAAFLEAEGAVAEALAAWCRAEAWDEVARLLGTGGHRLGAGGSWLDAVPPALIGHDPWLMLATARRLRAEGQWRQALETYNRAEAAFPGADAAVACRRERLALAAFLDPVPGPGTDWSSSLRSALARDPLGRHAVAVHPSREALGGPGGDELAAGLGSLLGGHVTEARRILAATADDPDTDPSIAAAAAVAAGTAALLEGDERGRGELQDAVGRAERAGLWWLARVGRAAAALDHADEAGIQATALLRSDAATALDPWGALIGSLLEGWATIAEPDRALRAFDDAADLARGVGAGTLEAWARALGALAAASLGLTDAREMALQAESLVRTVGVPGGRVIVHQALAAADQRFGPEHRALAEAACLETGLRPPGRPADGSPVPVDGSTEASAAGTATRPAGRPDVVIRLFGGFSIAVDGQALDLAGLKPRPRALLRLLALDAGRPVHREALTAAFWPDAEPEAAARNLHVAISGLRRALGDTDGGMIAREGDAYRLVLPPGARVDLIDFEEALAAAEAARRGEVTAEAIARYREAIALANGDLLPEDGPADWVVDRREIVRSSLAEAARALGELLLADDPGGASAACLAGLRADPYHDPLWRLLIEARERAGDRAAASSARAGYERMLDRLGIRPEVPGVNAGGMHAGLLPAAPGRDITVGLGTPPR
jgi:DNA-binding SARP family transcriptional activator